MTASHDKNRSTIIMDMSQEQINEEFRRIVGEPVLSPDQSFERCRSMPHYKKLTLLHDSGVTYSDNSNASI